MSGQSGLLTDFSADFVEHVPMSLHVVDSEGRIIWANKQELCTLGYRPNEYVGHDIAKFHVDQHVIDDILARLGRSETIQNYPARLRHKDGSIVYVEISSSPACDSSGYFHHTRCCTVNVTSRVLSEVQQKNQQNTKLLHQIFPKSVASAMCKGLPVTPTYFPNAAILFSDIVGFTAIASLLKPNEVFQLLRKVFAIMDLCAVTAGINKIETIGDGYMAAAGVPDKHAKPIEAIADFALLVQDVVGLVENPCVKGQSIQLRIGIHSGPVVGGVSAALMPRYCLFGDTVNMASRMESTGEAGKTQCSSFAAQALLEDGGFNVKVRGEVCVKGKGVIETFWLEPGSPQQGLDPNSSSIATQIREHVKAEAVSLLSRWSDCKVSNDDLSDSELQQPTALRSYADSTGIGQEDFFRSTTGSTEIDSTWGD
eukprot:TRINITY_DN83423_c0_g1_i1.p1 TRINITY_DN83423_c0_g1~~TRINITY_DN83423_c0_g1_i1.p1  ORF type:complete len:426 (+),score=70.49 TRINITY_DN83423_c0_g1_i1:83-1360(+)